jgi:ubiquinone/menaquinone biosynthesis C-methylase UbiE
MDQPREQNSENAAEFSFVSDDVFGRIANRYDLLCDLFSFGTHRIWKRAVAREISRQPWDTLLDGATGTGDIILRVLSHGNVAGRIDAYSISLGLKICDRSRALREAFRILRPGRRLIALEASSIPCGAVNTAYLWYMAFCMPIVGWIATGGDRSAYLYLLEGIRGFPSAEALVEEMKDVGFIEVEFQRLSLGVVAIHKAMKPGEQRA